jgi:hypothetical protein
MDLMLRRLRCSVAMVAACALAAACSSTSTSTVAPTSDKCQITASNTPSSFSAGGGTGSVTISTARDCTWSVAADAAWVALGGDHSGQGEAVVPFTVAANPAPAQRSGSIDVGGQKLSVNQAGAPCRFDLSRTRDSIAATGGSLSVGVTTLTGCSWTAVSTVSWITVASGKSGTASGTVGLTVAANTGSARDGIVNVAGQSYTVSQDGAAQPAPTPPAPTPSPAPTPAPTPTPPPPPPPPPTGGTPVHFDGTVLLLLGQCPNVSFVAALHPVVTNANTDYKHGSCDDLSNGDTVTIDGTEANGIVTATHIDTKGQHGDGG